MIYTYNNKEPMIHSMAYVAPGAYIIGHVTLHEKSSVWFNAVLRGDNAKIAIGRGSNVQDGTIVHVDEGYPVTVGEEVTIGHNVTLHGCTVEDGALIGMGATILNGAVIKTGALVAAGALVPEGKIIEEGMLAAGVPAKIVRPLTDDERERIRLGADHYIAHSTTYKKQFITEIDE